MARVALDSAPIAQSTSSGHIDTERWEKVGERCASRDEDGNCTRWEDVYDWVGGYTTSARINGHCNASSNNVYINSDNAVLNGDRTTESDSYSLGSNERYDGGAHSNASGTVTSGNSRNVYIRGKSVSVLGSSVRTHANTNTNINGGTSSNVYIGG